MSRGVSTGSTARGRLTAPGRSTTRNSSPGRRIVLAALLAATLPGVGCVAQAPPEPAALRTTPPPWPAPRDGISYFELAGVPSSRLDDRSNQYVLTLAIEIDGAAVPLVPNIGIDRPRALQAPAHTHDASGTVWLEGSGTGEVTLGQFFMLWGVRFDDRCLGAACGRLQVSADGQPVEHPSTLRLSEAEAVQIRVDSGG